MKFKDVAHLYLGCKMYNESIAKKFADIQKPYTPTTLRMVNTDGLFWVGKENDSRYLSETHLKPILRPINSMFENERIEYWQAVRDINSVQSDIQDAAATFYLLSKHFDLFGLIESGEAIDATTITPNTYNP